MLHPECSCVYLITHGDRDNPQPPQTTSRENNPINICWNHTLKANASQTLVYHKNTCISCLCAAFQSQTRDDRIPPSLITELLMHFHGPTILCAQPDPENNQRVLASPPARTGVQKLFRFKSSIRDHVCTCRCNAPLPLLPNLSPRPGLAHTITLILIHLRTLALQHVILSHRGLAHSLLLSPTCLPHPALQSSSGFPALSLLLRLALPVG